jgi:hypothetical protein
MRILEKIWSKLTNFYSFEDIFNCSDNFPIYLANYNKKDPKNHDFFSISVKKSELCPIVSHILAKYPFFLLFSITMGRKNWPL